ncbi:MAG: 4-(cytidine 5'-diphospho)-2-C-methyl-D-erythritol kinase [bacterium]|nr:4-(cytidine 5'-diphospho)-2-C-methyl-D-erythritol kinase [bacterium]
MIHFPNCKINLGLNVLNKRPDGFHSIETVFYPVNWCDALEILPHDDHTQAFNYSQSGLAIEGQLENNLIYKAWKLISTESKLPPLKVHLHKNIPMGAGLGGGSSDAAFFINALNKTFKLGYTEKQKASMASSLGSDCAFFIKNKPVFATEKGDVFSETPLDLSTYYILIVYPGINSNTKAAYNMLVPGPPTHALKKVIEKKPLSKWKNFLVNDFEEVVLKKFPDIKLLKEHLYKQGAIYACMSGSGSSVFGIFKNEPSLNFPEGYSFFVQKPSAIIL